MTATSWQTIGDAEDDVYTTVFRRPAGLGRSMVQPIASELEVRKRANVFLTRDASDPPPPWRGLDALDALDAFEAFDVEMEACPVMARPVLGIVRRRSLLPWLLGVMAFALTFGVLHDPVARKEAAAHVRSAKSVARSGAMGLYHFVSPHRGLD